MVATAKPRWSATPPRPSTTNHGHGTLGSRSNVTSVEATFGPGGTSYSHTSEQEVSAETHHVHRVLVLDPRAARHDLGAAHGSRNTSSHGPTRPKRTQRRPDQRAAQLTKARPKHPTPGPPTTANKASTTNHVALLSLPDYRNTDTDVDDIQSRTCNHIVIAPGPSEEGLWSNWQAEYAPDHCIDPRATFYTEQTTDNTESNDDHEAPHCTLGKGGGVQPLGR